MEFNPMSNLDLRFTLGTISSWTSPLRSLRAGTSRLVFNGIQSNIKSRLTFHFVMNFPYEKRTRWGKTFGGQWNTQCYIETDLSQ